MTAHDPWVEAMISRVWGSLGSRHRWNDRNHRQAGAALRIAVYRMKEKSHTVIFCRPTSQHHELCKEKITTLREGFLGIKGQLVKNVWSFHPSSRRALRQVAQAQTYKLKRDRAGIDREARAISKQRRLFTMHVRHRSELKHMATWVTLKERSVKFSRRRKVPRKNIAIIVDGQGRVDKEHPEWSRRG